MKDTKNRGNYLKILKVSEYRKFLLSNLINRFGDSVESIAFTWVVYQITNSASWSAIVFALNMLPNVIVQPFAGAIVENMNKKQVVIATHFLRASLITLFIILFKLDYVNPLILSCFTLIITTVESFNLPASTSFIVQVIKREDMNAGISLNSVFTNAASLIGSGAAGFVIANFGAEAAMFIDVSTFVIAAILIKLIKVATDAVSNDTDCTKSISSGYLKMLKEGIVYVFKTPVVRNLCTICIVLNCMLIPLSALQAPIADDIFGMGSELLSFAGIFSSIGGIVGAVILPYIAKILSPLKITIWGIFLLIIGMTCIPAGRLVKGNALLSYILISASFFIMVSASSLVIGIINIQFMKCVDHNYLARAAAFFNSSVIAAMPISSFIVSMLISHISVMYMLIGSIAVSMVILILIMILRPILEKPEEKTNET